MGEVPYIDPAKLYTVDEAARKLMILKPELSFEEARKMVRKAIDTGELPLHKF